ncbi:MULTISPECIES: recombination regulator RecX [Clostridium]|uniref:Regulatory protein RecX n=1 Tax=Clostridium nitritogenes TaxID=83340 RepID=A0ABN1LKK5_9CLOT|nr:recombination regulator RecX [Clostridium baratii]AQM58688.1 recombination regulator RecX [Clostridium baratii]KJU71250.1 recombinase RecX [Clostridium baratii]MBS6043677.1 recombination regulator RecX [Clostridium baratii]MBT9832675.1 recombination regulator RecX [Clostridium baratii]MDY3206844.1 recombination regulator RecX [Clostridium baratii]
MSKITKIETGKRNKERVNVYIDDEYAFSINMELVYKFGLKVNEEVNKEKLIEISKSENLSKCKESALRTIERSYKTEKEIRDKLLAKEFDIETVDSTINFLIEYGFIDDSKFVSMYIKDRIRTQGRNKIRYSLISKGVNKLLIEEAFSTLDRDDEMERAIILCEKKYLNISKREDDDFKIKNKLTRYLLGRGYDYDIAKEVIKEVFIKYKGE